jgi:hypothetical protein
LRYILLNGLPTLLEEDRQPAMIEGLRKLIDDANARKAEKARSLLGGSVTSPAAGDSGTGR